MKRTSQYTPRRTAAQWHQIVEAQQASKLSAPAYCKESQISYSSFMNWKKKLTTSAKNSDNSIPAFIELTPEPEPTPLPATSNKDSQPVMIELDLGSGIQLRISRAS